MKPTKYILPYTEIANFLSKTQLAEHYKLYEGYYNQTIDLPPKINGISKTDNVSNIRGLQKTLQYALSGRELHEIYFDIMSPEKTNINTISDNFKKLLENSFGSVDNFISDMKASAKTARGWYRLELDSTNQILYHNVGDFHDEGSTSGFEPIIALDMYDHAYFYDYQTNKGEYIDKFVEHLDWEKVNKRI